MNIIIIGGGVVGLFNAYYLNKSGHNVTIIDESDITNSTSFGNAGVMSAYDKTPLSYPGVISDTIINILKGKSPLVIKPSLDVNLYKWLWKFMRSSSPTNTKKAISLFEKYGEVATQAYKNLEKEENINFDFHNDGCLLAFIDKTKFQKRVSMLKDSEHCEVIEKSKLQEYLPFTDGSLAGGINLKRNSWFDPEKLMLCLKKILQLKGVKFILNEKIEKFEIEENKIIGIKSQNKTYQADQYILSTGAKQKLFKQLGANLLMVPAKGYSITATMDESLTPKISTLIFDIFTMMTPRANSIRFTSKLELNIKDNTPHKKVIDDILNNVRNFSNKFELKDEIYWAGNRPLTPNDLPLIGRSKQYNNVVFATGLGWLGMTFAPAIGKIIDDLVTKNQKNEENKDIMAFSGFYN